MMDIMSSFKLKIKTNTNGTFDAVLETDDGSHEDNIGALYYVIAVVFIYGLSIVMMIASHIRKNKQDSQLRNYLKEMSVLRKNDRREKLYNKMTTIPPSAKNVVLNLVHEEEKSTTEEASAQTPLTGNASSDSIISKGDEPDSVFCSQNEEVFETPKTSNTPRQEKAHFQFEVIDEYSPL